MKLRNKKTGEIVVADITRMVSGVEFDCGQTLAKICKEWEDYEEPEVIYYLSWDGVVLHSADKTGWQDAKQIGNYFETKEEAEKAVEKLKAWKRLKDNGFKFDGWKRDEKYCGDFTITATDQISCDNKDLDLLFNEKEYLRKEVEKIIEKNADYYDRFGGEE